MSKMAADPILQSPDDGSPLVPQGHALLDSSGNRYELAGGAIDLRPKNEVCGTLEYRLVPHRTIRDFAYSKTLVPTESTNGGGVKDGNVAAFLPQAEPGEAALDHGCGAGKFRPLIESRGYRYVGVDNEVGASTYQGGSGFRNGSTHLADLHRLPFINDTFRFAVSYSVFEHLQQPQVAARELFRVMKPGGTAFIAIAALIPFHMDSFYHHTHFGTLATLLGAGFEVQQVAGANWNGYRAISEMDGLPGPKRVRGAASRAMVGLQRALWAVRSITKGRDRAEDELLRHLMMAGIIKAVVRKPD